jgi:hypothetical protein
VDVAPLRLNHGGNNGDADSKALNESYWECIVHVGDMASLALDQTPLTTQILKKTPMGNVDDASCPYFMWPSPRHRVVSSTNTDRVSLVYFGYPPAQQSLSNIQKSLKSWLPSKRGKCLPLQEYYLLRDQSVTAITREGLSPSHPSTSASSFAQATYESIWNRPIHEIVQLKWRQVNRVANEKS